jgi:hypothetical protein
MANKRIFYAIQQAGLAPAGTTGAGSFTLAHAVKGLQSCGINTRFNLEQVFEMGQIQIYQNIENLPDVEITMEKVLDGHPLIYHLATKGSNSATLTGRSNVKSSFVLSIFDDTQDSASGTPLTEVYCSGVFVSAVNYNFPVDGNFTESVTLVGNNKIWRTSGFFFTGQFDQTGSESAPLAAEGVNRKQYIIFGSGTNACKLPAGVGGVDGIDVSGYNLIGSDGNYGAHIQSIRVQANLGREALNELGRKGPYHRYVNFPVEVRCDIEVLSTRGDMTDATETGVLGNGNNLADKSIFLATTEGTKLNLGTKCKLASTNYGNANAGGRGGNATVTYSYTTFNDLTVIHPQDPTAGLAG